MDFRTEAYDALPNNSVKATALFCLAFIILSTVFSRWILSAGDKVGIPTVTPGPFFLPAFLKRIKYTWTASTVIAEGYEKYKNSRFRTLRTSCDIEILSNKYAEELKGLPESKLSQTQAIIEELFGDYTGTNILMESHLHSDTLLHKLTPRLGRLLPTFKEEIEFAIEKEFPQCKDEWASVTFYDLMLRVIARVTSRILVGLPLCRDETWLDLSITYTVNVFTTIQLLKIVPSFLRPVIVRLLPSYWRLQRQTKLGNELLVPLINSRRASATGEKADDYLQWMMDAAVGNDGIAENLARRQLIITLGSIHSTTMGVVHAIYDLITHPEHIEPLRAEMKQHFFGNGKPSISSMAEMKLLDSFLKESQRFNPPGLLTFHRLAKETIELSDGTTISKGTKFYLLSGPVLMDPENVSEPQTFDGYRWMNMREQKKIGAQKETFVNSLHFGHGRGACPGRYFAEKDIKCILSYLLNRYEFKFTGARAIRPANQMVDERIFPDPKATILVRQLNKER